MEYSAIKYQNERVYPMGQRSVTEYVILGALILAPKHGYHIMQFLDSALESTWRVSTSQLYALLKRLQSERLLQSSLETQDARPNKRVFELTDEGKRIFIDWLHTPTPNVRDFRMAFLTKLFFFHHYSMPGAIDLVESQIRLLEIRIDEMREQLKEEEEPYKRLVCEFKIHTVESHLSWLSSKARPFTGEYTKN